MPSRPNVNNRSNSSVFYQTYPEVTSEINLLTDGPAKQNGQDMCRTILVMGAMDAADTEILIVRRQDDTDVVIPVPAAAVGQPFELQARALLPYTSTAVRHSAGTGPAVSLTGVPAGNYEIMIDVTTGGALNVGQFRWSDDGGSTWEEETVTLPADGTHTLGATGLVANFAAGTYVTADLYEAETFVSSVTNILVLW